MKRGGKGKEGVGKKAEDREREGVWEDTGGMKEGRAEKIGNGEQKEKEGQTHSRAGLIKLEKQGWVFLWILYGLQSLRPHGDGTPVRPHKVSYKVGR